MTGPIIFIVTQTMWVTWAAGLVRHLTSSSMTPRGEQGVIRDTRWASCKPQIGRKLPSRHVYNLDNLLGCHLHTTVNFSRERSLSVRVGII